METETHEDVECVDRRDPIERKDFYEIDVGTSSNGGPGRIFEVTVKNLNNRITHRLDRTKQLVMIINTGAAEYYVQFKKANMIEEAGKPVVLTGPVTLIPVDPSIDVTVSAFLTSRILIGVVESTEFFPADR